LQRVAGLDVDPTVIPEAVKAITPPSDETDHYIPPRWQRLECEIWQGGLEKHNRRLEGFEAIVALEL
jgi:hypothetical protein